MLIRDGERELAVIGQVMKDTTRVPFLLVGVVRGLEIVGADSRCFPCKIRLFAPEAVFTESP